MRWRSRLGVTLAALSALGACGKSHQTVSGPPAGHGATAGSTGGGGSTGGSDGGAPDTGATGGNAATTAVGGNAGSAGSVASGRSGGTAMSGGTTSSAGLAGSAGTTGDAGAPDRDDHTPTAILPECVKEKLPSEELEPATEVRVGSTWLRSSERDCEWRVGEPIPLPLEPDDVPLLLFQFDLNGDHVDDLIFGDSAHGPTTASGLPLVLLTSRLEDGELGYERSSCDSPWDVTYRSFFARDLDRDGVLDFVVGRINGISAMLNRDGERPEVLHYEWPAGQASDAWVSILDVAVGDFDADGRDDIAIGYDRATGVGLATMESGVLLFRDRSAQGTYGPPQPLVALSVDLSGPPGQPRSVPAGILATMDTGAGTNALFGLNMTSQDGTGFKYEDGETVTFAAPIEIDHPIFAQGARFGGAPSLMLATREDLVVLAPTAPPSTPPPWAVYEALASVHLSYFHADDHELGGGSRVRSVFLVDVDGDGDEDLVERGSDGFGEPSRLWIHNRTSETRFADAVLVQDDHSSSQYPESPFVRAGVMPARLFVGEGTADGAALYPIACAGP